MTTTTVYPYAVGPTSAWAPNTGTALAAILLPDDDDTTYIDSGTGANTLQQFYCHVADIYAGSLVSNITIHWRVKRTGIPSTNHNLTFSFAIEGGGAHEGTSSPISSPATWTSSSTSFTVSPVKRWGGGDLLIGISKTSSPADRLRCTSLYAVITYSQKGISRYYSHAQTWRRGEI